jgi:ADP-ribose pyrophosphatase
MKKLGQKTVYEGKWLFVAENLYENKHGEQYTYETVYRKRSTVGVIVVARLMPSKRFILIKQYRPALEGYILSFPAGLGFDEPEHGLVELKQETGYSGKIIQTSPVLKTGASLISDSARIIYVEVDENAPENKNPQQELETAEDIEVLLLKQDEARDYIIKNEQKGLHIAANLWYIFGLDINT